MGTVLASSPATGSDNESRLELNRVRITRFAFLSFLALIICVFVFFEWAVLIRLGPMDRWVSKPFEVGPFIVGLASGPALFAIGLLMYFRIPTGVELRPEGVVVTPLRGSFCLLEWNDSKFDLSVMAETWPRNRDRATLNWSNMRWMPASGLTGESARKLLDAARSHGLDVRPPGRFPGLVITRIRSRRKEAN